MTEQNRTARTPKTATPAACTVAWCVRPPGMLDCGGDHWADPGGPHWPSVNATANAHARTYSLAAAPTWGEVDGLDPAVLLYVTNDGEGEESSIDFTPAQARRLAVQLLLAAAAVTS